MKNSATRFVLILSVVTLASFGLALAAPGAPACTAIASNAPLLPIDGGAPTCTSTTSEAAEAIEASLTCGTIDGLLSTDDARGKPPKNSCCDPDLEPGVGGNPFCFEGHTCCANGSWGCNNADGSPSCSPGVVCDGSCGQSGDSCSSGGDCCSGKCKGNGRCR